MGAPLRSVSLFTIWAPPPQISFFACYRGGHLTFSFFFTKYMGAPSDQFLRLLYGVPSDQFLCILFGGPSQIIFFSYYMGPLSDQFFSSFFFYRKNYYCCRARRLSVRLSSVEIISFRGNSLSNRPINLKIGLNVREGVVHV